MGSEGHPWPCPPSVQNALHAVLKLYTGQARQLGGQERSEVGTHDPGSPPSWAGRELLGSHMHLTLRAKAWGWWNQDLGSKPQSETPGPTEAPSHPRRRKGQPRSPTGGCRAVEQTTQSPPRQCPRPMNLFVGLYCS